MDHGTIRERLTGPVPSIRTPFNEDGSVDFSGLRKIIDANIDAGAKTIMLTPGDSHYMCLSDEEIRDVTRVSATYTSNRAMVVAADRRYDTKRAVEYAKFAKDVGADIVMCQPTNWAASCTSESLAVHYATVAKHLPVMVVTNVFSGQGAEFAIETIQEAREQTDDIVAIKDDITGEFARRLCMALHDECAIIAGGQKQNHMEIHPYGCVGYLSTLLTISPEITHDYWDAIASGDIRTGTKIIEEYDAPFFDKIMTYPGGFDAGIHGALEIVGLADRYRRSPYHSLTDEEMGDLRTFLEENGFVQSMMGGSHQILNAKNIWNLLHFEPLTSTSHI